MDRSLFSLLGALALLAAALTLCPAGDAASRETRRAIGGAAVAPRAALAIGAQAAPESGLAILAVEPVEPLDAADGQPDPDGVGPCPDAYAHLGVDRRGLDEEGRPTWWHTDGSVTTRIVQRVRGGGRVTAVPAILRLMPQIAQKSPADPR